MKVVSMVEREYFDLTMKAGLECTCTLEHLMTLVEGARDGLKRVIDDVNTGNSQDIKDYIAHNIEKLDVYTDITREQLYKLENMLKGIQ